MSTRKEKGITIKVVEREKEQAMKITVVDAPEEKKDSAMEEEKKEEKMEEEGKKEGL